MRRAEGQGRAGRTAVGSEEGGGVSDHSRGGGRGRRGGRRRGRRGGSVPEEPPPLGLPLEVEVVLLLALLPGPLVVIFLLQVPDGRPPVLLEILLVFWSRTQWAWLEGERERGKLGCGGVGVWGHPPPPRCHRGLQRASVSKEPILVPGAGSVKPQPSQGSQSSCRAPKGKPDGKILAGDSCALGIK